jgi:hypothetical protein
MQVTGNCWYLETGNEEYNTFDRNLVAYVQPIAPLGGTGQGGATRVEVMGSGQCSAMHVCEGMCHGQHHQPHMIVSMRLLVHGLQASRRVHGAVAN